MMLSDNYFGGVTMLLGVDYYPEQWEAERLEEDLDGIVELGCNVIRIGEFAWHVMEPEEGRFDFSFFDRVIKKAGERGLSIIFGTPTAAPPAWLAHRYPDVLSVDENGLRRAFGGRHVACYSSPDYLEHCEKITRALLEHYRGEERIAAWQIDNELGHEGSDKCFCSNCRRRFQNFLSAKHGDVSRLNAAWGTVFWGQEYDSFEEIPLPTVTIAPHNPALRLDWERFCGENIRSFADAQVKLIRDIMPGALIIHDFPGGGLSKSLDYPALAALLDKAAYNNYPVWGGQMHPLPPSEIAFGLDHMRGLKGENFWITEAIMGAQGHDLTGYLPRPGQAKLWSWQAMAHGCEGLLYFRYRGAAKGAEQFCYGIIDPDNVKGRRFYEAQSFFTEVREFENELKTPIHRGAAILYDYDSLASLRIQPQSRLLDGERELKRLHGSLYRLGIGADVIPAQRDFSVYSLVLAPCMTVTDADFRRRLCEFVENGGVAVLSFRTSVKDRNNNLVFGERLPVGLCELLGMHVAECESLASEDELELSSGGRAGVFREMLEPDTAETLCRYADEFYSGYAAVTRNDYGQGAAYYIGTAPDDHTLDAIVESAALRAGLEPQTLPEGVELAHRGRLSILMNHNCRPAQALGLSLAPFEVKTLLT